MCTFFAFCKMFDSGLSSSPNGTPGVKGAFFSRQRGDLMLTGGSLLVSQSDTVNNPTGIANGQLDSNSKELDTIRSTKKMNSKLGSNI
jgi:hypothetical protein